MSLVFQFLSYHNNDTSVGYRGLRNKSLFCREPRLIKGLLFKTGSRSEYSFVCFADCQEFLGGGREGEGVILFLFCFCFLLQIIFRPEVTCDVTVTQTLL